jgi:hypothetical protein
VHRTARVAQERRWLTRHGLICDSPAGTKEETKPLLEHETRPLSTERETKPLLQKEKEKETEERPSGIFIGGGEAATTGPSSV